MTKKPKGAFVALLRGVNVGGNGIIRMKDLKESFEKAGFEGVSTYINSGNVIFESTETDPRKLEKKIEKILSGEYRLENKAVVRSRDEMESLIESIPKGWGEGDDRKYNVIFLRHSIDSEEFADTLAIKPDIEEVIYVKGTLLWSALMKGITRSAMLKLSQRKEYQDMTVRNLNTTRKIWEILKARGV